MSFLVRGPTPLSDPGCSEAGWGDGYRLAASLISCPGLPDMSEPTPHSQQLSVEWERPPGEGVAMWFVWLRRPLLT